jgi:hypothetical protein
MRTSLWKDQQRLPAITFYFLPPIGAYRPKLLRCPQEFTSFLSGGEGAASSVRGIF